jgi:glutamyl-tRNA synthetase
MLNPVRVRFAPSPTGALHVGGARTAIYNWAFARRNGGVFVLRIDDTDPERSTAQNTAQILRSLEWLGLDWNEGPGVEGPFGPYFQTQRFAKYAAALDSMKAKDRAYPCFCSAEELETKRVATRAAEGAPGYDRTCRRLDPAIVAERLAAGEPHVWRLAVPADRGDIVVEDQVRGEIVFPASAMDDFVLARADGTPTYNFATVVDDAEMRMTHIIRGDDHITNTPLQILVYEALDQPVPAFAHLSMIWGPDGRKLSKRHGATSVEAFHADGFLHEALLNYLALLGWSLDGETTVFSPEALKAHFSLDRIAKSPAIFDFEKLEWMNGVYIRDMEPDAFVARMSPWLLEAELVSADDLATRREWFLALAPLVSARIKRMTEVVPAVRFLFGRDIAMDPAAIESTLARDGAGLALQAVCDALAALGEWTPEAIEAALRATPETLGMKPKMVFQVARVAIAGTTVSLPLFESVALLGRETALARLEAARSIATH